MTSVLIRGVSECCILWFSPLRVGMLCFMGFLRGACPERSEWAFGMTYTPPIDARHSEFRAPAPKCGGHNAAMTFVMRFFHKFTLFSEKCKVMKYSVLQNMSLVGQPKCCPYRRPGVKWWRTAQVMSVQMPGHYTRGRQSLLLSFEYMVFMAPPGV